MCFEKRVILTVPIQCEVGVREIIDRICWHSQIIVEKESNGLRVRMKISTYEFNVEKMLTALRTGFIPYTICVIKNGNIVNTEHRRFIGREESPEESINNTDLPWNDGEGNQYLLKKLLTD